MSNLYLQTSCVGFELLALLLGSNRPSLDVAERRLQPAKPVSVQGPSEGKEERGSQWHRPAGERTTQDRERGA